MYLIVGTVVSQSHLIFHNINFVRLPLGFNRNKTLYDLMSINGFREQLAVLRDNISQIEKEERNNKNRQNLFPKILFLGTGSSVPSKHRNVTGILINLSPTEHLLLDCGEGTYSQLFRFYGSEESDKVLTRIKLIFISHIHPDHHLGLIALLKARRQAFSNLGLKSYKLFLLGPRHVFQYLGQYNQRFEPVFDEFTFIPNNSFDYVSPDKTIIHESDIFSSTSLKNILTTPVKHCPFAYGISFIDKNGWKLTYSGDTMPCDSLVDIGKLSDVLIHEATMEDDLKRDAQIKMHSTVSEAIEIGRKMCAKFTLLTHFSQRYCKVPRLNTDLAPNTGISFDMMIVSMSDLKKLPLLIPALRVMFAEQEEMHKARAFKRKMREEQDEDIVRIVEQFAVEDMNSR